MIFAAILVCIIENIHLLVLLKINLFDLIDVVKLLTIFKNI
jgi:hypothetical protein